MICYKICNVCPAKFSEIWVARFLRKYFEFSFYILKSFNDILGECFCFSIRGFPMKVWKICALFAVACAVIAGAVCYAGSRLTKAPEPASPEPGLTYDTTSVMRSYESWMFFSENFHAAYKDSAFTGKYQLVYPIRYPLDTLQGSKFDSLLLSLIFGEDAPKEVNRMSIQAALDDMMRKDAERTHRWWDETKVEYGANWRDEVCGCTAYFYTMPIGNASHWISFQQIEDYRCGGNGGPVEKYYTIVKGDRSVMEPYGMKPYVMDTTAFVPGFREKLIEMITDNVIFNRYARYDDDRVNREMVRQATAEEFKGNFQPVLTLSGVQFLFFIWSLPLTSHADGQIPVIVPYNTIQEILTEKFKKDIGL